MLAACALAGLLVSGCSKASSSGEGGAQAKVSGPITDAGDTGFRETAPPAGVLGDAHQGEVVFNANCSTCHGAGGAGGGIGPVLKGEKSRKDFNAAVAWIKNPQPPMPKLYPSSISETDVQNVATYVESL